MGQFQKTPMRDCGQWHHHVQISPGTDHTVDQTTHQDKSVEGITARSDHPGNSEMMDPPVLMRVLAQLLTFLDMVVMNLVTTLIVQDLIHWEGLNQREADEAISLMKVFQTMVLLVPYLTHRVSYQKIMALFDMKIGLMKAGMIMTMII